MTLTLYSAGDGCGGRPILVHHVTYCSKTNTWTVTPIREPTKEILENLEEKTDYKQYNSTTKRKEWYTEVYVKTEDNLGIALNAGEFYILR
jgi:hypothetical protein